MAQPPSIESVARAGRPLGMPPARFLRDYWQKRPLLIRGAFAHFKNPVEPNDLAGLACEDLALARIVIEKKMEARSRGSGGGNVRGADSQWELRTGPFAEDDFAKLPKTHWTLLVQDVDKWDADVAALLDHFSFLPSWRIDDVMISYAEDGGSVGAHVDQYDVFLLQGLGRRRWQIDCTRVPRNSPHIPVRTPQLKAEDFRDDTELKLLREFTPSHEWVLEPGDMLYLPPGVPHHGVALGACMTYSIGMRAPSQAELLVDFAETLAESLPEDRRLADPDLAPARGDGEIDAAAIARVMAAMPWLRWPAQSLESTSKPAPGLRRDDEHNAVPSAQLREWFGRFITRYRSAQTVMAHPRPLTDAAFARALAADARVRRNPWSRVAWLREGRAARLFVAGESHACSVGLARLVGAQSEFGLAAAPAAERDRAVLRALIDAGHFALLRPRGRRNPA